MLTGDTIPVKGVGHLRSPHLSELAPAHGVGYDIYNLYLNFLSWDKEKILQYDKVMGLRGVDRLSAAERLTTYDVITLLPETREFCREVLSFFMSETIEWEDETRKYVAYSTDDDEQHITGEICRENFEDVRSMMLQLNFIGLDQEDEHVTHTSDHSKELWERAQSFLKKQAEAKEKEDKPEYHIGNIVSKLCSVHPSYNFLNVWKLTVFQLYDAFFQCSYMRSSDLNEAIFSNHGGDKFSFESWLKPIIQNT